jgi:homoserine O-succinyltransferase/O-acetyltransferase
MKPVRIAILDMYDNHPNQGMRCIKQIVEDQVFPLEWKVFDVRSKKELPGTDFDIYISSGGPGCPVTGMEQWDRNWTQLIDSILAHNQNNRRDKKHVFLICHSFQMIVSHWKLAEITKRNSTAFGIFPVHKTKQGEGETLLSELPEPFYAVDSRDWQVVQPDSNRMAEFGATLLCIEKDRSHVPFERATMGIRFSNEIIGFQFHPEADVFGMNLYFQRPERRQHIIQTHGEKKYYEMIEYLRDKNKIQLTYNSVLPAFLKNAAFELRAIAL